MVKIRKGTDIIFKVRLSSGRLFPHDFTNSTIKSLRVTASVDANGCCNPTHTPNATSTNQCSGTRIPINEYALEQVSVSKLQGFSMPLQDLEIQTILRADWDYPAGIYRLQIEVEEYSNDDPCDTSVFTVDIKDAVQTVNSSEEKDPVALLVAQGVTTEMGTVIIPLEYTLP